MSDKRPFLSGRTAVVTGGSGGLCGPMAVELGRHGAKVAILGRSIERGKIVADRNKADGGLAEAFACDAVDAASVYQAHQDVTAAFGPCDILLNGAGGGHPGGNTSNEVMRLDDLASPDVKTFFNITLAGFQHVVDLNLLGTWLPSQVFGRDMPGRPGVTIINISSMAAYSPATKVPAYNVAKAGVDNLTRWLAVHLAEVGIRVNAIAPGFFLTDQNWRLHKTEDGSFTPRAEKVLAHTPMRRFGKPEDLLGALMWLVDERKSGFVTGITVPVDGGFVAASGI
jgi:NAD(P)-dependent dehydrogenase (short-subunit alcohol dehydrogenase family)